jgi:hypothetical protein
MAVEVANKDSISTKDFFVPTPKIKPLQIAIIKLDNFPLFRFRPAT